MTGAALRNLGRVATERITGLGPSRVRAAAAAVTTGTAAAIVTYKVLRAGS